MNYAEKEIYNTIGRNLKKLREVNFLNQDMIGDLLGVDRSTCSNWEHGKTMPKCSQIYKLSKLYNVSVDFLMTDHGSEFIVCSPPLQQVFGETFISQLTDEERFLLLKYRVLCDYDKKQVDDFIEELRMSDYYRKDVPELETEEE